MHDQPVCNGSAFWAYMGFRVKGLGVPGNLNLDLEPGFWVRFEV